MSTIEKLRHSLIKKKFVEKTNSNKKTIYFSLIFQREDVSLNYKRLNIV